MKGEKRRLRLILTVAAVVALAAAVGFPVLRPRPLMVETARAARGPLRVTIDAEGRTRVRDRYTVAAPVTGQLRRIELRRGDLVHAGSTLAIIAPAPAGALPPGEQGQAFNPQSAVVRSPITGRVLRLLEENERVVQAGTPLIELSNTSSLEVVADLLSTDAVKIKPGAPVLIEGWGGDEPLRARVRLVEPSAFTKVSALGIEEQRVNVISDFVGPAPLGDGFRVEGRFVVWEGADVLKVPSGAVFRRGDGWGGFLIEDGRARARAVEVGHRNEREVEIRRGLGEGDVVILHPSNQIAEGAAVEPRKEP